MSLSVPIIATLLSIFLFMHSFAWSAPVSKVGPPVGVTPIKGWKLLQAHSFQKNTLVYISSSAIRIDNVQDGWCILAVAPKWDAVVFSKPDKTYSLVPYLTWSKTGFQIFSLAEEAIALPLYTDDAAVPRAEFKVPPIGVLPVMVCRWAGKAPDVVSLMFRSEVNKKKSFYTLLVTKEIAVSKQEKELLAQYYQMGICGGMPIRLTSTLEKRPLLDTLQVEQIELSNDLFTLPKGYKALKSEADVYVNAKDRSKIDDFGQLIGK